MVSVSSVTSGVYTSQINKNNQAQSKALGQISSGKSVSKSSDGAAALAVASLLQSDVSTLKQSATNMVQGTSLLQTADGGLQQASGILDRMKELATQANSGSLDSNARSALNTEYQNLATELDGISSTTTFNGQKLLDGSFNQTFQSGTTGTDTIGADLSAVDASVSGLGLTPANGANPGALLTQAGAQAASTELDTAINNLSSYRAQVGSIASAFSTTGEGIESDINATTEAISAITDADIAQQATQFNNSKALSELSIAAAAQGNKMSSSLLRLVR